MEMLMTWWWHGQQYHWDDGRKRYENEDENAKRCGGRWWRSGRGGCRMIYTNTKYINMDTMQCQKTTESSQQLGRTSSSKVHVQTGNWNHDRFCPGKPKETSRFVVEKATLVPFSAQKIKSCYSSKKNCVGSWCYLSGYTVPVCSIVLKPLLFGSKQTYQVMFCMKSV